RLQRRMKPLSKGYGRHSQLARGARHGRQRTPAFVAADVKMHRYAVAQFQQRTRMASLQQSQHMRPIPPQRGARGINALEQGGRGDPRVKTEQPRIGMTEKGYRMRLIARGVQPRQNLLLQKINQAVGATAGPFSSSGIT